MMFIAVLHPPRLLVLASGPNSSGELSEAAATLLAAGGLFHPFTDYTVCKKIYDMIFFI